MSGKSSSRIPVSSSALAPSSGNVPRSGTKKVGRSKFDLIAELGRGGMATVYLARAKSRPERLIVLKQLRSDLADNPEFLAMFLEEARLAGKLQHPNIVETYEVGEDAGTYYIAMEYLDGLSLQAVLTKFGWKGNFTFAMQVYVLIEVLKGLDHAYNQLDDEGQPLRIVHRDVSPPNIIITFDGKVKLVDFGIAKAANSNVETRTGLIKGKLTYMAPEQAQSGDVDNRTDIYSVGVMLWQAAAGKRRWKGVENTDVLKRLHAGRVADSPNAESNGLPSAIDDIVLRSIHAEPDGRYESAVCLKATLEDLLEKTANRVTSADLVRFMSSSFGQARERADEVMRLRLSKLDEERVASTPLQKTSIPPTSRSTSSILAKHVGSVSTEALTLEATSSSTVSRTLVSPAGKSRTPMVGLISLVVATAIAAIAVRMHLGERISAPSNAPLAIASVTSSLPASAPPDALTNPPGARSHATVVGAPPSEIKPKPLTVRQGKDASNQRTPRGRVAPQYVAAPAAVPLPDPPAGISAPPPPAPTTPASSADAPSLDKQDPWQKSFAGRSDPWSGEASPGQKP